MANPWQPHLDFFQGLMNEYECKGVMGLVCPQGGSVLTGQIDDFKAETLNPLLTQDMVGDKKKVSLTIGAYTVSTLPPIYNSNAFFHFAPLKVEGGDNKHALKDHVLYFFPGAVSYAGYMVVLIAHKDNRAAPTSVLAKSAETYAPESDLARSAE